MGFKLKLTLHESYNKGWNKVMSKKMLDRISNGHKLQDKYGKEFYEEAKEILEHPVVLQMKQFNHHSQTSCYQHCVHVSYYCYRIAKILGWDAKALMKGGLLHDLFLYDWHDYTPGENERLHGFEHPNKALFNAHKYFKLTRKEGDIIVKHMFPLTLTLPSYKESYVIIMVDKFVSSCEVLDRFFKTKKRILNQKAR